MRIAFLEFAAVFGGAKMSTADEAMRLSSHADVTIIDAYGNPSFGEAARKAGVKYEILRPSGPKIIGGHSNKLRRLWRLAYSIPDLLALRSRARHLLRRIRPNVICSSNPKAAALAASAAPEFPIVAYMRGWYTPEQVLPYAQELLSKKAAWIIAVSRATKAALALTPGIDPSRITTIVNAIDLEAVRSAANGPLLAELPQSGRPIRILLPGMYTIAKGTHVAIRAMRLLRDAGSDAVLYLAGDEPFGMDATYVPRMRQLAVELGVADRIEWLGMRRDLLPIMQRSTVVVLPTLTEGMPRVVLEALALGKPMVTTPVGGNTELIFHGLTGWMFDIEDAAGLADCIRQIVDEPQTTAAVTKRGLELIGQPQFRPDVHTEKILEVFRRVAR